MLVYFITEYILNIVTLISISFLFCVTCGLREVDGEDVQVVVNDQVAGHEILNEDVVKQIMNCIETLKEFDIGFA